MRSFVLQTPPLFRSHTGPNIAQVSKSAVLEGKLGKISNLDVARRGAGLRQLGHQPRQSSTWCVIRALT